VNALLDCGDLAAATPAVGGLVDAAVRLFAACHEAGATPALTADGVAPTEALTLIGALLRAHDINAFDLALWLSHTESGSPSTTVPNHSEDR